MNESAISETARLCNINESIIEGVIRTHSELLRMYSFRDTGAIINTSIKYRLSHCQTKRIIDTYWGKVYPL